MESEATAEVIDGALVRAPVANDAGPDLLAIIDKRNKLLERILEYAIKVTHAEQWHDLGGKPWPSGAACEGMARRCGVSITNVRSEKQSLSDELGEYYNYTVWATFSLPSGFDSIVVPGTCSSRDQFLGTGSDKRELYEVDEGNIMKAAYTNCTVNGITRLLGVRNLSWERLAELGLGRDKMSKVEFEKGARGGGRKAEGADLVMKFGNGKDKTLAEQSDEDLAWYIGIFEKDLKSDDPKKVEFRSRTEKQLTAAKAEQARRANEKAGTAAKPTNGQPSFWERLKQLAGARGVSIERLRTLTKGHFKKDQVDPKEITEADFTAIADALAKEAPAAEETIS